MTVPTWASRLPWIDGGGGLVVGLVLLPLRGWLADLHGLPLEVMNVTVAANLIYGTCGLLLAASARPMPAIVGLALANIAWLFVCLGLVATHADTIGLTGVLHLGGEGVYVGVLGAVELRYRHAIRRAGA